MIEVARDRAGEVKLSLVARKTVQVGWGSACCCPLYLESESGSAVQT